MAIGFKQRVSARTRHMIPVFDPDPHIRSFPYRLKWWPYTAVCGYVAAATIVCEAASSIVPAISLTLIYLVAVLLSAQHYGLRPAVLASVLSILAWDYLFIPPFYSLEISNSSDVLAFLIFLIVSLVVSTMTSHIQLQNRQLARRAECKSTLYEFGQKLATAESQEKVADCAISYMSAILHCEIAIILGDNPTTNYHFYPSHLSDSPGFNSTELSAALFVSEVPHSSLTAEFFYLPLNALRGRIGAIRISGSSWALLAKDEKDLVASMVDQIAIAIERLWLAEEQKKVQIEVETERLRNTLLISVSHDLRTPLTTIIGSLTTLNVLNDDVSKSDRSELRSIALTEALRLDRFIGNLLDATRLEFGGLNPSLEPTNVTEVVEAVLQRASPLLQNHIVIRSFGLGISLANANFSLLEQAIFNVVDNAAKYAPHDTQIEVRVHVDGTIVVIEVLDQGPGIGPQFAETLFKKFVRAPWADSKAPGTGLGLVIAKGFIEALGGEISGRNRSDQSGAVFTIRIPIFNTRTVRPKNEMAGDVRS